MDTQTVSQGFEVPMHIELQRKDRDTIRAFEAEVVRFPEVVEARRMFGRIDYLVRVATADLESFESFAIDRLQALPGVMRVESHITMKLLKRELAQRHKLGIDDRRRQRRRSAFPHSGTEAEAVAPSHFSLSRGATALRPVERRRP